MGSRFYSERNAGERIRTNKNRATRSKTFKSEDEAKKYAESKGLKEYELVNMKSPEAKAKKVKIVAK